MLQLGLSELKPGDWIVLAAYFGALIGLGLWTSLRKVKDTREYFLAAQSMPVWAVAFSILSTAQSAATYVGVPQAAFEGDLRYLSSNIGGVAAAVILAIFVIPTFYRRRVGTPYELLESRFGATGRSAAAWAYLGGRVFASGARVFVAALPTSLVLFGDADASHVAWIIVGFTALGIALSLMGGVRSVIWLDVLQVVVYLGAALATIVFILGRLDADAGTIVGALRDGRTAAQIAEGAAGGGSKLTVVSISTDPSVQFTLWTGLTGFTLLTLASHGMDQDLVQRMLTCKSARKGSWSVISGVLIGIPAVTIFLGVGLLLWVYYNRPDLWTSGAAGIAGAGGGALTQAPGAGEQAFQAFALREMTGGLAGLVIAGLFACGPAGINSGLSAMSSTFVNDLYLRARPGRDERHYLRVGRWGVVGAGVSLGAMALFCITWYDAKDTSIIDFVLSVMNFAYAGLLGLFITALFTRRGSAASAVAALITGFLVVLFFQTPFWLWLASVWPSLSGGGLVSKVGVQSHLPWLKLAFPWQLVLAAGAATIVCMLGCGGTAPSADRPAYRPAP